jgi:hypothetical protein
MYIPAWTMWGAVTAELARATRENFPMYKEMGALIRKNARFTYLYPAEPVADGWRAWLPIFKEGQGLVWRPEDDSDLAGGLRERQMRKRLVGGRAGTSIDPESDSAEEGSLRETEFLLRAWRNTGNPVAMVGYMFLRQGTVGEELEEQFKALKRIFVGGDTRYGLGWLGQECIDSKRDVFGLAVRLESDTPFVCSSTVLAHALDSVGSTGLVGAREVIRRWNVGELADRDEELYWTPGSTVSEGKKTHWQLEEKGIWKPAEIRSELGMMAASER